MIPGCRADRMPCKSAVFCTLAPHAAAATRQLAVAHRLVGVAEARIPVVHLARIVREQIGTWNWRCRGQVCEIINDVAGCDQCTV